MEARGSGVARRYEGGGSKGAQWVEGIWNRKVGGAVGEEREGDMKP